MNISKKELERRCTEAYNIGFITGQQNIRDQTSFSLGADSVKAEMSIERSKAVTQLLQNAGQGFEAIARAVMSVTK